MCPGQFIAFIAHGWPSTSSLNIRSSYFEVPRYEEGLGVVDQRRLHLEIAALRVLALADLLELAPDHHPLRVPERRARRALREVEEVELPPEPPVIPALRLLDALEVGLEVVLRVERGAVDPRELRVLLVPAPVGAGEAGQLERLDRLRVLEVGPRQRSVNSPCV